MGEEAIVADILDRYEMMFGYVNLSHVLLAQFYAAEQQSGKSMTAWYARLEDLASRIIRKDASIMTPDNYDIVVNTQFWTKMANEHMKNALKHKFDAMASHSQFVVEARHLSLRQGHPRSINKVRSHHHGSSRVWILSWNDSQLWRVGQVSQFSP